MKKKIMNLFFVSLLVFVSVIRLDAQMRPLSVSETDYEKCINFCKDLDNSEERLVCMRGCSGVSIGTTGIFVKQITNLSAEINKKPMVDGQNLFYTDKKTGYQFYAASVLGGIADYLVRDKNGTLVPTEVITAQKASAKRCFIILPDGTWVEVTCPDIIIIVHEYMPRITR